MCMYVFKCGINIESVGWNFNEQIPYSLLNPDNSIKYKQKGGMWKTDRTSIVRVAKFKMSNAKIYECTHIHTNTHR